MCNDSGQAFLATSQAWFYKPKRYTRPSYQGSQDMLKALQVLPGQIQPTKKLFGFCGFLRKFDKLQGSHGASWGLYPKQEEHQSATNSKLCHGLTCRSTMLVLLAFNLSQPTARGKKIRLNRRLCTPKQSQGTRRSLYSVPPSAAFSNWCFKYMKIIFGHVILLFFFSQIVTTCAGGFNHHPISWKRCFL